MNDLLESEFGMHLREMAKHARAIALSGLLVGLALLAYQLTRPDEYRSTAAVRLVVDDQLADDGSITAFQTQSLAETALAADMLNAAAERAGITPDADSLRDRIDVEVRSTPGYLDVATTGPTAAGTAELANAMAAVLIDRVELDASSAATRSASLVDPADPADAEPTMTTTQALTQAIALGLLAAIVVGEGLVAWRLLRGRFSPIDPGVELQRLLGAPVIDLRDGRPLLPYYLDGLSSRPTLTVLQAGTRPSADLALRLARTSGEVHRRVLLVDGDTGRPVMHTALGEAQSPGLAEVAQGSQPMRAVVRPATPDMRAAVLTAGHRNHDHGTAAELLPTLQRVVGEVGADQVIVSVTQASSTDEILRATHAFPDAVVLAIDPSVLGVNDVRRLIDMVRSVKANIVGGVITRPTIEGMAL
ncbi:MAG: hypothetical protein R2733_15395 [Acidimicrobiales bacterium]